MDNLSKYIDQTILKPDATETDILNFLQGVIRYRFFCAVVNPCWVPLVIAELPEGIRVCSVVDFPLGASSTKTKVCAADDLVKQSCHEIDMVMNIGKLKEKEFKYVGEEIRAVSGACQGRILKVIIETCLLSQEEKVAAAKIIQESGAQFVKTSTGFAADGAKIDDVKLLRATVGRDFGVKASGGIRSNAQAVEFIKAGANRLGTSSGVQILKEAGE
jgi:deoxyribose-phosphate aldolase